VLKGVVDVPRMSQVVEQFEQMAGTVHDEHSIAAVECYVRRKHELEGW